MMHNEYNAVFWPQDAYNKTHKTPDLSFRMKDLYKHYSSNTSLRYKKTFVNFIYSIIFLFAF